jgi:Protein phosphatase 2C
MGSDSYFRMGSTHAICQDYAVAGESDNLTYALLSDGCSGRHIPGEPGSPYTDFGARFLVQCARRYLGEMVAQTFLATAIAHDARAIAHQARLPGVALDATLLVAVTNDRGPVVTFQTGDGVIASKSRDGVLRYESLEFGNNMPYYLSYLLSPPRLRSLFAPPPDSGAAPEAVGKLTITSGIRRPGADWDRAQTTINFEDGPIERKMVFAREDVELVLLFSDGVSSFQLKDGTAIPLEQVLDQMFELKGFTGQFLTRRCTRFLQKFCAEHGWQHADDFSVGGLHLGAP